MTTMLQNPLLLTILLILGIAIAIALIGVAVGLVLKSRSTADEKKSEAPGLDGRATWLSNDQPGMRASFRQAMHRLKEKLSGRGFPYRVPWYAIVGEPGSGKSSIAGTLRGAGAEVMEPDGVAPRWLLLDEAVLIDLPGAALISEEAAGGKNGTVGLPAFHSLLGKAGPVSGEDSPHLAWRAFLRLTARYRPRHPLNGIVLTVPATELIAAAADPDDPHRVRRLSTLAQRLAEVQRFTGLRLPIFVLLTKCDAVPGFSGYARAVFQDAARTVGRPDEPPSEIRDDLFGWSNPYSLDSDYSSSWVDEAFDTTHEVLLQRQLEVLAETNNVAAADAVFLLPFEFNRLRKPLQVFLDMVFRTTAYQNSHLLRGIYFCGREEEPAAALLGASGTHTQIQFLPPCSKEPDRSQILFVRDLFRFKIFPERFLAAPVSRGYLSGNRSVLAAQITAAALILLLGIGLYRAATRIENLEQNTLNPVLESLAGSLTNISMTSEADVTPAVNLLNSLGETSESAYLSPAMPASYLDLDGFRSKLHNTLAGVFDFVVLKSCATALETRITDVLNTDSAPAAVMQSQYPPGNAWSTEPAYLALDRFLTDLQALDKNIERYASVSSHGQGSFTELNALLHYLGGRGIPDTSRFGNDPRYQKLLLDAVWDPLRIPANYDSEMQNKSSALIEDFYRNWFDSNPLLGEVQGLSGSDGLQALTSTAILSNAQLLAFVNEAQSTDSQLDSGAYDWLAGSFQRENYPALGSVLDQASFATADFTDRVQVEGEEKFSALKDSLAKYPGVIDIGNGKVRLDPGVRALATVLNTVLGYDWMAAESGGSCSAVPRTSLWNQADLGNAVQIEAARAKVVNELLPSLPDAYRDKVQAIVDQRAANAIYLALQEAAAPSDTEEAAPSNVQAELDNFSQSANLLDQIAGGSAALHPTAANSCLRRVLARQAGALLASVNTEAEALFSPQPFAATSATDFPTSQWAYGVTSAAALQSYLASQQQTAENLDAGAAPLVKVLHAVGSRSSTIATWQKIEMDIDAFEAKKTNNPIQALETYISTDLDPIAPENGCKPPAPGFSPDMFLNIRTQLSGMAVTRCGQVALTRYGQIAADFKRLVAGRFPFSAAMDTRPGAEANPANVAQFYAAFDRDSPGLAGALAGASQNSTAAQEFLQEAASLRPLVLSLATPPAPALSVSVEFRTNREREVLADHIASWTLEFGQQTVASSGSAGGNQAAGALPQWQYGEPVTLIVRYAYDSPIVPSTANPSAAAHVQGGTVTYTYSDPWALFALMADHPSDSSITPDEYALIIPNQYTGAQGKSASPANTVAYMKIDLLPAGAKPGTASIPVPTIPFSAPSAAPKSTAGAGPTAGAGQ
jgi:type VI secretion system protein ImpL